MAYDQLAQLVDEPLYLPFVWHLVLQPQVCWSLCALVTMNHRDLKLCSESFERRAFLEELQRCHPVSRSPLHKSARGSGWPSVIAIVEGILYCFNLYSAFSRLLSPAVNCDHPLSFKPHFCWWGTLRSRFLQWRSSLLLGMSLLCCEVLWEKCMNLCLSLDRGSDSRECSFHLPLTVAKHMALLNIPSFGTGMD